MDVEGKGVMERDKGEARRMGRGGRRGKDGWMEGWRGRDEGRMWREG